jgi:hypothetical protein
LTEKKSRVFYQQINLMLPAEFFTLSDQKEYEDELNFSGYKKHGSSKWNKDELITVDLDLDLIDMLLYDPFLGENFIKCLFRYYSLLPEYVKQIFIEQYVENYDMCTAELSKSTKTCDLDQLAARMDKDLQIKLNLKLTHFPYSVKRIDPKALLSNNLLLNHGQLIKIKFARVISVFPPSCYILRRLKKRMCNCHLSPPELNEVNNNPLKIFKNLVNYAAPSGGKKGGLYYNVVGASDTDQKDNESFCSYCHEKYRVVMQKYAPCQKIEILDFGGDLFQRRNIINLRSNIS